MKRLSAAVSSLTDRATALPVNRLHRARRCLADLRIPVMNMQRSGIVPIVSTGESFRLPWIQASIFHIHPATGSISPGLYPGFWKADTFDAKVRSADGTMHDLKLYVKGLSEEEKRIVTEGCLMNYYKSLRTAADDE